MIFLDIFRGLQEHGVRYLVVGGLAMNLHGIPRMTADVDLYVDLEKANANRFLAAVKALGFVPGVPVSAESFADPEARDTWRREKNMLVMGFVNPSRPAIGLDAFVFEPVPFGPAYERRKRVREEKTGERRRRGAGDPGGVQGGPHCDEAGHRAAPGCIRREYPSAHSGGGRLKRQPGGYEYDVDDEQIRQWEAVPVEERLRWLEDANEFLFLAQDPETRAIWQAVRRGER